MKSRNIKSIILACVSVAMGSISIVGINPIGIGYFTAAYCEGVNGILLALCTLLGIFLSSSRTKILDYAIIIFLTGIMVFIVKRKKETISNLQSALIISGVCLGVRMAEFFGDSLFWIKTMFAISELVITICTAIVLRRSTAYIMRDKAIRKLGKEEMISLAILITIIASASVRIIGEKVNIIIIIGLFIVAMLMVIALKITMPKDDAERFDEIIYSKAANAKLKEYSHALMLLAKSVQSTINVKKLPSKEEVNKIFERVSQKYCGECELCTNCWEKEFYSTYNAASTIIEKGTNKGFIDSKDMPEDFMKRCTQAVYIVDDTNKFLEIERYNLRWMNKMNEARGAFALQINEMSKNMESFSNSLYQYADISNTDFRLIKYMFKQSGIKISDMCGFIRNDGKLEITVSAKSCGKNTIMIKESAEILNGVLNKRFRVVDNGRSRLYEKYQNITYIEECKYRVATGVARIVKNNEKRCGDNYSIVKSESNETVMIISDGMGAGERACEESEKVVNIVEQFVEAGFNKESAIRMLNSMLIINDEENTLSTIDLTIINQNTGMCEMIKSGAASSFVKRRKWVETIEASALPIGILYKADIESTTKQLYSGDFVIMITDGVVDELVGGEDKEETLEKIINEISANNPQSLADKILDRVTQNNSNIVDDMTVLVARIWENE